MGFDLYFILNLSANKLTLDDLGHVFEKVVDVSVQWYPLGLQLKVRISTLDNIRMQFQNPRDQLLEMLKVWLTSDNTSWKTLADALRSRSVGASQLAGVLEEKYFVVEPTEVDIGMFASDSWLVTPTFISAAFLTLIPKIGPPSKVSPPHFLIKLLQSMIFF